MSNKVLVLDDEAIIADDLAFILQDNGFQVVQANTADEALALLTSEVFSVACLDINLGEGGSGIDVAEEINKHYSIPFLFITSYTDRQTLREIETVNPTAYITKPYKPEEVLLTVRIALKKQHLKKDRKPLKIMVRDAQMLRPIDLNSLTLAKGEDNYTRLIMDNNREYLVSHTLKSIEQKLSGTQFCRVHKSYLINIDFIEAIEGNSLEIKGKSIPIGKTHRAHLFDLIEVL
ncbi:MAG: response regulator transcription factor [Bacteroidota bacterium]